MNVCVLCRVTNRPFWTDVMQKKKSAQDLCNDHIMILYITVNCCSQKCQECAAFTTVKSSCLMCSFCQSFYLTWIVLWWQTTLDISLIDYLVNLAVFSCPFKIAASWLSKSLWPSDWKDWKPLMLTIPSRRWLGHLTKYCFSNSYSLSFSLNTFLYTFSI